MNRLCILCLSASLFFAYSCGNNNPVSIAQSSSKVQRLSPADFQAQIDQLADEQIVDLRTAEEIAETGKIANAQNIDFYNDQFQQNIKQLDPKKPVMIYCAKGGRSGEASHQLQTLGYSNIIDLDGGMGAWQAAKMPTIKP